MDGIFFLTTKPYFTMASSSECDYNSREMSSPEVDYNSRDEECVDVHVDRVGCEDKRMREESGTDEPLSLTARHESRTKRFRKTRNSKPKPNEGDAIRHTRMLTEIAKDCVMDCGAVGSNCPNIRCGPQRDCRRRLLQRLRNETNSTTRGLAMLVAAVSAEREARLAMSNTERKESLKHRLTYVTNSKYTLNAEFFHLRRSVSGHFVG